VGRSLAALSATASWRRIVPRSSTDRRSATTAKRGSYSASARIGVEVRSIPSAGIGGERLPDRDDRGGAGLGGATSDITTSCPDPFARSVPTVRTAPCAIPSPRGDTSPSQIADR
jgi:hypothetical protein